MTHPPTVGGILVNNRDKRNGVDGETIGTEARVTRSRGVKLAESVSGYRAWALRFPALASMGIHLSRTSVNAVISLRVTGSAGGR
jgi:hypothetical protein